MGVGPLPFVKEGGAAANLKDWNLITSLASFALDNSTLYHLSSVSIWPAKLSLTKPDFGSRVWLSQNLT